jgi:uncharacterized protein YceK
MAVVRFFAVALLFVLILGGCQSFMQNDPIMGDHPWQPGQSAPQKASSSSWGPS